MVVDRQRRLNHHALAEVLRDHSCQTLATRTFHLRRHTCHSQPRALAKAMAVCGNVQKMAAMKLHPVGSHELPTGSFDLVGAWKRAGGYP